MVQRLIRPTVRYKAAFHIPQQYLKVDFLFLVRPFKAQAQTAVFKAPVRTAL